MAEAVPDSDDYPLTSVFCDYTEAGQTVNCLTVAYVITLDLI